MIGNENIQTADTNLVLTLNNTNARYSKCLGYCFLHRCYITCTQYKKRKCIAKNCKYFKKEENAEYWQQLKAKKQNKKKKKQKSI